MLLMKFKKSGNAVFVAHTDVINALKRAIRRIGLEVNYSRGFHPHTLVYLSPPIPLGIGSLSEWAFIDTAAEIDPKEFLLLYNSNCPEGLEGLECYTVTKNPNVAGVCCAAEYLLNSPLLAEKEKEIREFIAPPFYITITKKGETAEKEVGGLIRSVDFDESGMKLTCAFGNENLRIDGFLAALNEKFGFELKVFDVVKTKLYVKNKKGVKMPVKRYIYGL